MKGTFYTLRIHDAKRAGEGMKIFGVRLAKFLPEGWMHWQGLTPSSSLLWEMKGLEKEGKWDDGAFQTQYRPRYMWELKQRTEAKEELERICTFLEEGRDVYYACYCGAEHRCHRSLVRELVQTKGYQTETFLPNK